MLKKNLLLMGRKKEQRKVKLTIEAYEHSTGYNYGYTLGYYGSLDVLPYWGDPKNKIRSLVCRDRHTTSFSLTPGYTGVTAYVKGYPQGISAGIDMNGDPYSMYGSGGDVRYLTFDSPPPLVTWIQKHSNRSRNRVLCRRRSSLFSILSLPRNFS